MRRPLLLVLALTAIAATVPLQAAGHEKTSSWSAAATLFGGDRALGVFRATAVPDPHPLEGTGENMRIVANVPMAGSVAASDLELAGDYAYVGSYGEGMVIVDISDPRNPKRAGVFRCPGGQNDVQLQPGSNPRYAVLAIESTANECGPVVNGEPAYAGNEGFIVIDISDKANPTEVAFIGQGPDEGGVEDGAHNTTMDWPYLFVDQYQPTHGDEGKVDVFDLRRVIAGDKDPVAVLPAQGGGFHDMQVDHRPDGKVIAYAASIGFTDELDFSDPDPTKWTFLKRYTAAEHGVGISHGIEPNHDRTLVIESDEYGGGSGVGACGGGDATGPLPIGAINVRSPGALHFLELETEGENAGRLKTLPGGQKLAEAGAFNLPAQTNPSPNEGCTAHVFWQAPDENRLVVAWYGRGTRIVDFSDPANPRELGHFIPTQTETWSAKPHKGYIFAGDTVRGLDVLEYTGEDCARWPTTSGAAEVQRARYQGTAPPPDPESPRSTPAGCGPPPATPPAPGPGTGGTTGQPPAEPPAPASTQPSGGAGAAVGGYRFVRTVRVPRSSARRRTVRLQILSAPGRKVLASRRYRVRTGHRARIRAAVGGAPALYSWRIRLGRRTLSRGVFAVKTASRVRVPGATPLKLRIGRLTR